MYNYKKRKKLETVRTAVILILIPPDQEINCRKINNLEKLTDELNIYYSYSQLDQEVLGDRYIIKKMLHLRIELVIRARKKLQRLAILYAYEHSRKITRN